MTTRPGLGPCAEACFDGFLMTFDDILKELRESEDSDFAHFAAESFVLLAEDDRAGVVARLGSCIEGWCRVSKDGEDGWVPRRVLWGLMNGEVRD